eukprot:CAMPEP_0203690780 /NCGR_PEP_ID=MMETSP0091-20130426/3139_1 /ASSEMBLY_ACC=CAM_ASM_001089 /TAXON_ID=426623 /ORGANISM="Chaetoceros affinis, Strain CCMP159" /LENGTH=142 /DNA_ID=CAMNT_0050561049 /DNA_START=26 /DNA_END=454 /DNA_ORIENTATION=-
MDLDSVSIDVRFTLPASEEKGEASVIEKCFDETNCETARIGLAPGVEAIKPQGGDYSYSGMHDHGPLPLPKEGGNFAKLIGMVDEARKHSNNILTKIIQEQNEASKDKKKKAKQKFENNNSIDQNSAIHSEKTKRQKIEASN